MARACHLPCSTPITATSGSLGRISLKCSDRTSAMVRRGTNRFCAIPFLCMILALSRLHCAVSSQLQPPADVAQLQHAGHSRRLLSCMILKDPTYTSKTPATNGLPFCSTQYANTGAANGWVAVAADTDHEMIRANAADVAYAWHTDPDNPRTMGNLKCTGEVNTTKSKCWGGNGTYRMPTFASISCCSNQQMCYIKTGGCVV